MNLNLDEIEVSEDKDSFPVERIYPQVKTAWVNIQCWPDEQYPDLMRLRVILELNGEPFQDLVNTLFDRKPGNGLICQSNNLTWLKRKFEPLGEK